MTDAPVPVAPSPKFQLKLYGDVPLAVLAVKVTVVFTRGLIGETAKLVDIGCVVADPKNSVMGFALASFEVSELRPQTVSRVLRYE